MLRPVLRICPLLVILVACRDPKPSVYPTQNTYVEDTTAGMNDLLEIRVAKQEQLTGDYEIGANGMISFPYVGEVKADGQTPLQIQTDIQSKLADGYLRNPQVTVRFKERRSKKVNVFGEVRNGKTLPFNDGMTISEAISAAGGFTPRAWENAVKVTRHSTKATEANEEFTVPVKEIANGAAPTFYMRPGDSVYVPKSPL